MKKVFKDILTAPLVIFLFFFFLLLTPVALILMWFFRVPYVFFRGTHEICATFWKSMNDAYEEKRRAQRPIIKEIASSERIN